MEDKDLKQISDLITVGLNSRLEKLEQKMFDWKSEIIDTVDGLALEIRGNREFREIGGHNVIENTKRIAKLEKKVFGNITEV